MGIYIYIYAEQVEMDSYRSHSFMSYIFILVKESIFLFSFCWILPLGWSVLPFSVDALSSICIMIVSYFYFSLTLE